MCSYCGCQSISVIGRFMAEHEEIVNLAGNLRRAGADGGPEAVDRELEHVLSHLHPHTGAEEVGLFTVLRRNPDFVDHVDQLCAEHTSLEALASQIRAGRHELIEQFVDDLREHINKEENGLFPAAAIELDGPDWLEVVDLTPGSAEQAHH